MNLLPSVGHFTENHFIFNSEDENLMVTEMVHKQRINYQFTLDMKGPN